MFISIMFKGAKISNCEVFRHLEFIIKWNNRSKEDVDHKMDEIKDHVKSICDKWMTLKLKAKCYVTGVQPVMLYGTEC